MYLLKSFTLEDNNYRTVVTFDLFIKEGEPILMESALESNGSSAVRTYYGYEDIFDRLWTLSLMSDHKVRRVINALRQCLIDERYGSK